MARPPRSGDSAGWGGLFRPAGERRRRYSIPFLTRSGVRRSAVEEHRDLVEAVSEALFRHDPLGIATLTNADEYDPEAESIVLRLVGDVDVTSADQMLTLAHEVFVASFDAEMAGPEERYAEAAQEIWRLWTATG